jgi:hypothetical protein
MVQINYKLLLLPNDFLRKTKALNRKNLRISVITGRILGRIESAQIEALGLQMKKKVG